MNKFLTTVALGLALTVPANAADTALWSHVGDWEVRVDRTVGNGCYAYASYVEGGAWLRVGFDMRSRTPFIVISDAWRSAIKPGDGYRLSIQFDNREPSSGTALGVELGSLKAFALTVDATIIDQFAKSHVLRLYANGSVISTLSLAGSAAALTETLACQAAMNESAAGVSVDADKPKPREFGV